jgi:hypothetical protein
MEKLDWKVLHNKVDEIISDVEFTKKSKKHLCIGVKIVYIRRTTLLILMI